MLKGAVVLIYVYVLQAGLAQAPSLGANRHEHAELLSAMKNPGAGHKRAAFLLLRRLPTAALELNLPGGTDTRWGLARAMTN